MYSLLTDMLNKYTMLKESGKFKQPTEDQKKIVALKAAVKSIKDTNVKLNTKLGKKKNGKREQP